MVDLLVIPPVIREVDLSPTQFGLGREGIMSVFQQNRIYTMFCIDIACSVNSVYSAMTSQLLQEKKTLIC